MLIPHPPLSRCLERPTLGITICKKSSLFRDISWYFLIESCKIHFVVNSLIAFLVIRGAVLQLLIHTWMVKLLISFGSLTLPAIVNRNFISEMKGRSSFLHERMSWVGSLRVWWRIIQAPERPDCTLLFTSVVTKGY